MPDILEQIYESSLKFLVPLDPVVTYRTIVNEAKKIAHAEYGSLYIAKKGQLFRIYLSGPKSRLLKIRKNGFTYETFRTGKPKIIPREELIKVHPEIKKGKMKSFLQIPLSYKNQSLGVLNLQSTKKNKFTQEDLKNLKLFGAMASLAIKKSQLYTTTKEALDARDLFISMAAHELRTPLTTINGYAQLFDQKLSRGETPKPEWIKTLKFETHRLSTLVNELLEVDQIKRGQFQYNFQICNLNEIMNRALTDFKFTYPKHKIKLVNTLTNLDDKTIGDCDKILQVFQNVLENAADFSSPNKPIKITLKKNHTNLIIKVNDKGKGIPKKDLSHLFEEFYKASNSKQESIGIGLFLCKKIIDTHHGSIQIGSKLNKGTQVEIKLPISKNHG